MKLLFFSDDAAEVEEACRDLGQAGIPCEVRHNRTVPAAPAPAACAELWIQDDHDAHRALLRCAELGVGFSRRPPKPPAEEESEGRDDEVRRAA